MLILNQFLIESYLSPDAKIEAELTILTNFIDHIDQPFKEQKELTTVQFIAENIFTNFHTLDNATQQHVFHITQRLTEQNIALCYDEQTLHCYKNIVQLWTKFGYLQMAIGNTCIFLTPARFAYPLSIQELDRTQCLIAFAIKHFQYLSENIQKQIRQLTDLIKIPPLPDFLVEPQANRYISFVGLIRKIPTLQPTPPSLPLLQKSSHLPKILQQFIKPKFSADTFEKEATFISPNFSQKELTVIKAKEEAEREEKKYIQQAQLKKICRLSQHLCKHYFPISWMGSDFQQKEFMKKFEKQYPNVAKELFFHPPSHVSQFQFQILYQSLHEGINFLKAAKIHSSSSPISKEDLHELLNDNLGRLFLYWRPQKTPMNSFFSLITVDSCQLVLDRFLTPDGFYFLLDRLLSSDPWDLDDFNKEKIPLEFFPLDKKLTQEFGDILQDFVEELVLLGDPTWIAKAVSEILLKIIKFKKYDFAEDMQKQLHQIKSSPCSMTPLLVLHRILVHEEQDQLQAAWFNWQQLTPQEKIKRQEEIEIKLNACLYEFIHAFIQKYAGFVGGWMVDLASSIKIFCQTLTQKLWQIFQKEESIKLLMLYLLQGIEKSILNNRS